SALPGSPDRKSRFMQNSVMRVLGSAGLKFPSELSVKGSARIDTDSSATARVEVDDKVNKEGEMGAADAGKNSAHIKAIKTAQNTEAKHLRIAKARIFIGRFLKYSRVISQVRSFQRKSWWRGHRAIAPWFKRL